MCMPRRPEYIYRRFGVVLPTSKSSNPGPSFSYSFNLKSEALRYTAWIFTNTDERSSSLGNYTVYIFILKQNCIEEYSQQKLLLKEISKGRQREESIQTAWDTMGKAETKVGVLADDITLLARRSNCSVHEDRYETLKCFRQIENSFSFQLTFQFTPSSEALRTERFWIVAMV
jgi:hypothetical protein